MSNRWLTRAAQKLDHLFARTYRAATSSRNTTPTPDRAATIRERFPHPARLLPLALLALAAHAQTAGDEFFESKIRPVLIEKCYGCHSSKLKTPMGGLVLDTKPGMRQGGTSGPVIVPGKPQESRLVKALQYSDLNLKMPPTGKLPDNVIADFEQWIANGAIDPRAEIAALAAAPARRVIDLEGGRKWWAFQPVRELEAPAARDTKWPRSRLDGFVLAKLEGHGLAPSPEADARTLIRRVYLDLTGLKPSFDEVEAFAADASPDRYEKLVDRLLASPHYGERWARYWLDVARYAEDNHGNITNPPYPYAWRYRDWVIEALNRDMPYDRFVRLQLAADLVPGTPRQDLRALGYLGISPIEHKDGRLAGDVVESLQLDDWDERVDAVSRGLLGLTVGCARCHDHKFDPIRSQDYYSLLSVFASTARATRPLFTIDPQVETRFLWLDQRIFDLNYFANLLANEPGSKAEQAARQVRKFRDELARLNVEVAEIARRYPEIARYMAGQRYPGEKKKGQTQADANAPFLNGVYDAGLWMDNSEPDVTLMDYRPGQPRDLPIYRGGNVNTPGEAAPRAFPAVLAKDPGARFGHGSGRLELADRIFSDGAALAARVMVNRVWAWHFDRPLVDTQSDFGAQGDKPTHPELLDDLAARFIAHGWSLKWLHREILLSATYRQSSRPRPEAVDQDPANQWLWRMNPRRLDIEAYRDSILQAAGTLDETMSGPSADLESSRRRTIYAKISRSRGGDLLRLYDFPEPVQHSPGRGLTITPLQQLFVMNSGFIQQQAAALAELAQREQQPGAQVRLLYRRVFAREPSAKELDLGLSYISKATLAQFAQGLLAANEEIFWP